MSRSSKMSEPLPPMLFSEAELPLMSSAEGSPAKTLASPAAERAWAASAVGSGPNTSVWLATFDLDTSSWRTLQLCLEGGLTAFSETWPRSGLMRSGTAYQLPPLVPLTAGIESGSWPTPNAMDGSKLRLSDTPANWAAERLRHAKLGNRKQLSLCIAARAFPAGEIPAVQEDMIAIIIEGQGLDTIGILNPRWVEWLMGFPSNWLKMNSAPSETPLSPKSRK